MTKKEYIKRARRSGGWRYILIRHEGGIAVHELHYIDGSFCWTEQEVGLFGGTVDEFLKVLKELKRMAKDGLVFTEEELLRENGEYDVE